MVTSTRRSASLATTRTPCPIAETATHPSASIPARNPAALRIRLASRDHLLSGIVERHLLTCLDRGDIHAQGNGVAVAGLDGRIGRLARAHAFHPVAHVGRGLGIGTGV